MNKVLIILLLISFGSQSQELVQFVNAESKQAIPLVTIQVGKKIFYADIKGQADQSIFAQDKEYRISSMAYKPLSLKGPLLQDTIEMEMQAIQLKEVEVKPVEQRKERSLGFFRKSSFPPTTFIGRDSLFLCVHIENEYKQPKLIGEILFRFKQVAESQQFLALLFECTSDQKPGKVIYSRLVETEGLKDKARVSILAENHYLPKEGLFVGFAWVADDAKGINLYDELRVKMVKERNQNPAFMFYKGEWVSLLPGVPRFGLTIYE